jgi:CrcB protein
MELIKQCLAIGVGGFLGALSRYGVTRLLQGTAEKMMGRTWSFPLGTLVVNVTGCFVLGLFFALASERTNPHVRLGVAVGFVGAYTTFSTLMFDTSSLVEKGELYKAAVNLLVSLLVGFAAVRLGSVCAGALRVGGR